MFSSVIRDMRYDARSRTLSIWLNPDGRRYNYHDVPLTVYEAFRGAESKGRFFLANIRDDYSYSIGDDLYFVAEPRSFSPVIGRSL